MAVKGQKQGPRLLTFRQMRAIVALTACEDKKHAAKKARVPYESLLRWMKKPVFMDAYQQQVEKLFKVAQLEVQSIVRQAFEKVHLLMNYAEKESDQLRAAGMIIDSAYKANEITELRAALAKYEAIEQMMKERSIHGEVGNGGVEDKPASRQPSASHELRHEGSGEGGSDGSASQGLQQVPGETGSLHEGDPGVRPSVGPDRRGDGEPEPPAV